MYCIVIYDCFLPTGATHSGQGWVGWKNDTRNGQPIEIKFEFDKIREFSAVHLYCNNQFQKDVQVKRFLKKNKTFKTTFYPS